KMSQQQIPNPHHPHKITHPYVHSILSLLSIPATDEFFTHVRSDVSWTVTGSSFLSGHWSTKESYRAATFDRIGTLLKAPGIKLKITEGDGDGDGDGDGNGGIIIGGGGWVTADLYTFDTFTRDGTRYEQFYAWHVKFDDEGMIERVKVWLDTLVLEKVLGGEERGGGIP
ncbi:MAG: hypothetical protein Q9169_007659, partial [Polycauliona sp. 2 TL-2023]